MLNKERMLINACDVPNGKTNNMVKRDVKYTNPMSLQEASPIKQASLKSNIDEQSMLLLLPLDEHNLFMCTLYLSICSINKRIDVPNPPNRTKR